MQNGGFANVEDIIGKVYGNVKEKERIDKSKYYAEVIISQYNWSQIGIEGFKAYERNELIKRLQDKNCIEIYERLQQEVIEEK